MLKNVAVYLIHVSNRSKERWIYRPSPFEDTHPVNVIQYISFPYANYVSKKKKYIENRNNKKYLFFSNTKIVSWKTSRFDISPRTLFVSTNEQKSRYRMIQLIVSSYFHRRNVF